MVNPFYFLELPGDETERKNCSRMWWQRKNGMRLTKAVFIYLSFILVSVVNHFPEAIHNCDI